MIQNIRSIPDGLLYLKKKKVGRNKATKGNQMESSTIRSNEQNNEESNINFNHPYFW